MRHPPAGMCRLRSQEKQEVMRKSIQIPRSNWRCCLWMLPKSTQQAPQGDPDPACRREKAVAAEGDTELLRAWSQSSPQSCVESGRWPGLDASVCKTVTGCGPKEGRTVGVLSAAEVTCRQAPAMGAAHFSRKASDPA